MQCLVLLRVNALLALAATGTAVAAYLSWMALDGGQEVACGPVGDCAAVQSSQYAEVAGVPVSLPGLGMYMLLLLLAGLRRFRASAPPIMAVWTFALALGGTLYSAYLTYLELFVIEAICLLCVVSAAVVTAILLLSVPDLRTVYGLRRIARVCGGASGRRPDADL